MLPIRLIQGAKISAEKAGMLSHHPEAGLDIDKGDGPNQAVGETAPGTQYSSQQGEQA